MQQQNADQTHGSTGPRTPAGKQRSSSNARKHGFTGRTFIVAEHEQAAFEQFLTAWQNELKPQGAIEAEFFGQVTHSAWTLRRLSDAAAIQNKLRLYSIYKGRAERSLRQGLADLRKLQEERLLRAAVLGKDNQLPVLPRAVVLRQQIDRDKRTHSRQTLTDIEAYLNAPMPGQTTSTVPK